MTTRWQPGDVIVRREILGLAPVPPPDPRPAWFGRPWTAVATHVVEDRPEQLVSYFGEGAEMAFPDGPWPTSDGRHPWAGRSGWTGHGCLMVQRPGDPYAVWHFWDGPDRTFLCWYLNLQADFRRTSIGYDTQDLELDYVVWPDGTWEEKDRELLATRVEDGRFTEALAAWVLDVGADIASRLAAGDRWWDPTWATWEPPDDWRDARLPRGWDRPV